MVLVQKLAALPLAVSGHRRRDSLGRGKLADKRPALGRDPAGLSDRLCGKSSLPEDTAHAIEAAFAQYGEDLNGDRIVSVKLNQYVSDTEDVENASTYALAAQMQFLADMNAEESYFLLLDDPAHFQLDYQALANWDGTPPGDNDYTAAGKTVSWVDCPVLAGYDLGTYQTTVLGTTVTGSSTELVNGLFLGRRAFYEEPKNEKAALAREGAQRLWEILTEGATP